MGFINSYIKQKPRCSLFLVGKTLATWVRYSTIGGRIYDTLVFAIPRWGTLATWGSLFHIGGRIAETWDRYTLGGILRI
jgi:hypothetical protein